MTYIPADAHGSISTYTNHACRCDECKAENARVQAEFRSAQRAKRIVIDGDFFHPEANHGTSTAYNAYGCRCRVCRAGHATVKRERAVRAR
ncbi:hypothetical protein [Rhodococcoides fascians]|uniref:hypothetical protein n=1 Tax=Rhodococcoides fascians TaxID=1828 RepID=UPI0005626316|nr:hypothetical protein [Rhodococcus fascians]